MSDVIPVDGLLTVTDNLIGVLQEIQSQFHYLPEEALRAVARHFHRPLREVYHIATFYKCFSLEPQPPHQIRVCLGTACHVRGGQRILEKVLRELKLPVPGVTADFQFGVAPVYCLGCCALAPVLRLDQSTFGQLRQSLVPKILKKYKKPAATAAD